MSAGATRNTLTHNTATGNGTAGGFDLVDGNDTGILIGCPNTWKHNIFVTEDNAPDPCVN